jgi:putative hemolysin
MTAILQAALELSTRTQTLGGAVAVAVLIALSGFFSSSEIAMFSLADHRVDAMVEDGEPGAKVVQELKSDPHRLLVTILVGNNVVNIAMASISTTVLALHLSPTESVLVATFGITALVLLFGESAPKSYAVEHTELWARTIARPLKLSEYAMYPLVAVFDVLTRQINRLTGSSGNIETPYVTRAELEQLIETGEREGVLEREERELLVGVLRFRNRIAKELMQSRLDVTAVEAAASLGEAIDRCIDEDRDRLPVYEGTLDTVVGIVELADLARASRDAGSHDGTVGDLATSALTIPESKDADELLVEMREDHQDMAIVVDEFGATQGLVTVEDLVEEIVGEILEEAERPTMEELDDRTLRVAGSLNLHELNEALSVTVPEGEAFETAAGFVYDSLGRVPVPGETVEHEGVALTVERMDGPRIITLRVDRPEPFEEGDDGDDGDGDDGDGDDVDT